MMGFCCDTCGFGVAHPIAELRTTWLGFFDDARFPGRGVLVLKQHIEHFPELEMETAHAFASDCQDAARAIHAATGAVRINYAMLGNVVHHLHMHLIPRLQSDPIPRQTPWEHPQPETALPAEQVEHWIERIRMQLKQGRTSSA